jgi:orotate phosphoribosyltransferase-like protein
MRELDTGYSDTIFQPERLRRTAKRVLDVIRRVETAIGEPVHIAVTGKSGIAMAFAVNMLGDVPIVAVRKDAETSHGNKIEGLGELRKYIVLDDFVCTGHTVERVVKEISQWAEVGGWDNPECLGFIEYCRLAGHVGQTRSVGTVLGNIVNLDLPAKV